jgi:spore germination cell wall hydrolase CwlJ-like protein
MVITSIFSDETSFQKLGRVVFGEARGESTTGQLAVAYTVVNRINSNLYPNTLDGVLGAKYGSHHEYNTLDEHSHDTAWSSAKRHDTLEYQHAIQAARYALCGTRSDPTTCATAYCATYIHHCSALQDNRYSRVTKQITIGGHTFVCRVSTR